MTKSIFGLNMFQPIGLMYGKYAISWYYSLSAAFSGKSAPSWDMSGLQPESWDDAPSYGVSNFQPDTISSINYVNSLQNPNTSLKGLKIKTWGIVLRNSHSTLNF